MRFQDTFARCTALNSLAALEDLAAIRTKQNKNVVNAAMFQLCHPVPSTFFPPNHRINSTPMLDTARYSGRQGRLLFYPFLLWLSSLLFILFDKK